MVYGLSIYLRLTGSLHPKFAEDGQAVDFFDNGNVSVLHYGSLKVKDATGRQLNAKMEGYAERGGGIRIVIYDSNAVYPITVDPLTTSPTWTATGENSGDYFGLSVATAGDVNGDGYSDVIVGAPYSSNTGKAYLYLGGPTGLSTSSSWDAAGEAADDEFGFSVATAGDVNGDGYSDVIVGAYRFNSYTGKAYLYTGGPSGLSAASSWDAVGEAADDYFGRSVATAGDVNGDGYSDVIVGAWGYSSNAGKACLYAGGPSGLSAASSWDDVGEVSGDYFGYSVAAAGDVNGDGYSDVIVGAFGYSGYTGKAYLYTGGPTGLSTSSSWDAAGEAADDEFGFSVATAGHVNGDGYSDVIVGACCFNSNTGKAYVYFGGGGPGVPVLPRQMRSDLTAPIAPLGLALDEQFRLQLMLRTPFGRGGVKIEWQAVPLGTTFNPSWNPIQSGALWKDSHISGSQGNALIDVTPEVGPYKWRARVRYNTATCPFQQHSRWFTPSANGLQETDLRSALQVACVEPDEACWIYEEDKSVPENFPILNWEDWNQANQLTGWNVRRSNDPALPKDQWPIVASNIVDGDAGAINYQWTDSSGDDPGPGNIWYYEVTTYNAYCPAEGPF